MNKVIVVVFDDEKRAYEGSRAVRDLHREGSLTVYSDAVVVKDANGKVSVRRAPESDPEGTLAGFLLGSLAGLFAGPVGLAVGAGTGTLIGAAFDLTEAGIGEDFVLEVSEYLLPGKAAVVADLDEEWQTPLDSKMEALGGRVFRRNRIDLEDEHFEKQIAAYEAELDALDAEMAKASAERKAKLQARIRQAQEKLDAQRKALKTRIDTLKREGDAKLESLKQQIATADAANRERLKKRHDEVRADYQRRVSKLEQAWELTRSALKP